MQTLESPKEKNFRMHLEWHLFRYGTRPSGQRKLWDKREFVEALVEARQHDSISSRRSYRSETARGDAADARRNLNSWLRGDHRCEDRPWGVLVEKVLFGDELGRNPVLDEWHAQFHAARQARSQERHRADLYVSESLLENESVRGAMLQRVSAGLKKHGWRLDIMEKGQGCTSLEFNRAIIVKPPEIRIRTLPSEWSALDRYSDDLLTFALAQKTGDANPDRKIRIASDFINQKSVDIQEANYFGSLMTDQLAWVQVRSKAVQKDGMTPETVLWDGMSAFIEKETGELKGLGEALISNQLAASTLAFSSDGHLMIVHQNDKNRQSPNTLAPSGSGSLDWADVTNSEAKDFLSLVRWGAERELREECALDDDGSGRRRISSSVMLTGFVRLLHRAGKPEFFCLGRIAAPAHEIRKRTPERYVEEVLRSELACVNWEAARPTDEIVRVCQAYLKSLFQHEGVRIPLSYPLEHALKLLIEVCNDARLASVIDRFMSTPPDESRSLPELRRKAVWIETR